MRTWLYIDGYNFYYSIKNNLPRELIGLGWCDFRKLAEQYFLQPGDSLKQISYFTTPVGEYARDREEGHKQETWLKAVNTIEKLAVKKGKFKQSDVKKREEKMTDVNIAVELILDAINQNGCEKALILSADLDLYPAAYAIANRIQTPRVAEFWFPPRMEAYTLRNRCRRDHMKCSDITEKMLFLSRFPDEIKHEGKKIVNEPGWRLPSDIAKRYDWAKEK